MELYLSIVTQLITNINLNVKANNTSPLVYTPGANDNYGSWEKQEKQKYTDALKFYRLPKIFSVF